MVGIDAIVRSVQVHWNDVFDACPTVFPGQQIDVSSQTAWVELWVDLWDEQARREDGPERISVSATVHCFSRHEADTTEISRIADAGRAALTRQTVGVFDHGQSGAPLVGWLRLRESELREMTRSHDGDLRGALRHVVVLCRGTAESV